MILFAMAVAFAAAQSSGFYTPTLYKVREKLGDLAARLDEVEDEERHYEDMIDVLERDIKNTVTKKETYTIGRKISHLRSKLVVFNQKRMSLLRAVKSVVKTIPHKFRAQMIRSLRIEKRFNSIRSITKDAKAILQPKKTVTHKSSTKAAIKRLGHGIAKKVF